MTIDEVRRHVRAIKATASPAGGEHAEALSSAIMHLKETLADIRSVYAEDIDDPDQDEATGLANQMERIANIVDTALRA